MTTQPLLLIDLFNGQVGYTMELPQQVGRVAL